MLAQPNTLIQPPPPSPPSPHKTPFGLRIIIGLFVFKTLLFLILASIATIDPQAVISINGTPALGDELSISLIMYLFLGIAGLIAAIGLWRRKHWAWVLTMVLLALSMTLDIISYFQGDAIYFSMALNVIQVGYLNQSEVQDLFGEAANR